MISHEEAKKRVEEERNQPHYPPLAGYKEAAPSSGKRTKPKPRLDELDKWDTP